MFQTARLAVMVVLATAPWASRARAQQAAATDAATAGDAESAESARWYGWQTLVADGASLGLVLWANSESYDEVAAVGVGTLIVGAPLIHVGHGHLDKGLGSLGLRVIPVGLYYALNSMDCLGSPDNSERPAAACILTTLGYVISLPVPVIVDAAVLAYEPVERRSPRLALAPWVDPVRSVFGAAVSGTL